ncbi:MAG: apolipoprotein N-acyltransferase [Propionicimonas sp.]
MVDWLAARHWGVRMVVAILAGVLTALGFQPYAWWPLLLIGVAGLTVVILASRRVRGATGLGFAFGVGFLLLCLGWMQVIFVEAMFGLVAVEALFFALLGALIKVAARTPWWPLLAAACWTGVEFTYARFPFNGFGWMRLGYAMVDSPLAWLLPLVGVPGLGFATALVAQGIAWIALAPSPRRIIVSGVVLGAVLALAGAGTVVPAGQQVGTVNAGYVQGGAPGGGVYGLGEARTITRNHVAETFRLADRVAAGEVPRPDFVVMPENSTDMDPYTDAVTGGLVRSAVTRIGVAALVGVILDGPGPEERQTASLWWDPKLGELDRYIKRGIVPFGEWVPLRSLLLPLISELRYVGDQSIPGTSPGVMPVTLPDGRRTTLGIMICFDLVYDDFAADTVIHGGQVLVVQSSNAMYQGTGQIQQQFAITRARALELRREILVVTTSGVSGLINADGTTAFTLPEHVGASGVVTLPQRNGVTPAALLGGWLELAVVLLAALGLAASLACGRMTWWPPETGEDND